MDTADVLSCHDLKTIRKYQLPVVYADFIRKSVKNGKLLPTDAYEVNTSQGDTSNQWPDRHGRYIWHGVAIYQLLWERTFQKVNISNQVLRNQQPWILGIKLI